MAESQQNEDHAPIVRVPIKTTTGIRILDAYQVHDDEPTYVFVQNALKAPRFSDAYVVEMVGKPDLITGEFDARVRAYIDRFGRVFAQDAPSEMPPACEPDLALVPSGAPALPGEEVGFVEVLCSNGEKIRPASYIRCGKRIDVTDSLYDFGPRTHGLPVDEALARLFLAFVLRPHEQGHDFIAFTLATIHANLEKSPLLTQLRITKQQIDEACRTSIMQPPALACCFSRWLRDAGIAQALAMTPHSHSTQLTLTEDTRYSGMYVIVPEPGCIIPERTVWKLESVLNRYRLCEQRAKNQANRMSMSDCLSIDARSFKQVALQSPDAANPVTNRPGASEWQVRYNISTNLRRMRLPIRCKQRFRLNLAKGIAAIELTVPDADMMPASEWDQKSQKWTSIVPDRRELLARNYAERLGVLATAIMFQASARIKHVYVCARPFNTEGDVVEDDLASLLSETHASPSRDRFACVYTVEFKRSSFCKDNAYLQAVQGLFSLAEFFKECNADFTPSQAADIFDNVPAEERTVRAQAYTTPVKKMSHHAQAALGANDARDLEINYNAETRAVAERLAESLPATGDLSECIKTVRKTQNSVDDPLVFNGCTRLMTALVQGEVDVADKNSIVNAFLGDDYHAALIERCTALIEQGEKQEVESLILAAVNEAQTAGCYDSDEKSVRHTFDSASSRIVYNLLREGKLHIEGIDLTGEKEKNVELVSDSLYYCTLEAAHLLEGQFDKVDEALHMGQLCIALAPTIVTGYMQTARIYMLVGDTECARKLLVSALQMTMVPHLISRIYYQLGYVEWKAGRLDSAMACYLKAIVESTGARTQAISELRMLLSEEGVDLLDRTKIESTLVQAGIPLVPTDQLIGAVEKAGAAAVDEGLFDVARNLLPYVLNKEYDEALEMLIESLEI